MLQVTTLIVGQLRTNCYLVTDAPVRKTVIIDPGDDASYIADTITKQNLKPVSVYATHGHFDHVLAGFELQNIFQIPFYVHCRDEFLLPRMRKTAEFYLNCETVELPPVPSKKLQKQQVMKVGRSLFLILDTPGHTPGGVSFYSSRHNMCFTGDTVFAQGKIGSWDHVYADKERLLESAARILALPPGTVLYPGHGDKTTVREIKPC